MSRVAVSRVAAELVPSSQFRRRPRFIVEGFAYLLENGSTALPAQYPPEGS